MLKDQSKDLRSIVMTSMKHQGLSNAKCSKCKKKKILCVAQSSSKKASSTCKSMTTQRMKKNDPLTVMKNQMKPKKSTPNKTRKV